MSFILFHLGESSYISLCIIDLCSHMFAMNTHRHEKCRWYTDMSVHIKGFTLFIIFYSYLFAYYLWNASFIARFFCYIASAQCKNSDKQKYQVLLLIALLSGENACGRKTAIATYVALLLPLIAGFVVTVVNAVVASAWTEVAVIKVSNQSLLRSCCGVTKKEGKRPKS